MGAVGVQRVMEIKVEETGSVEWIWQKPDWPNFTWKNEELASSLRVATQLQSKLLGQIISVGADDAKTELDAQLQNIVQSSAIEGENLNEESVRSSLAKHLGLEYAGLSQPTSKTEGLVEIQLDATRNYRQGLTLERLNKWHTLLFPGSHEEFRNKAIKKGELRGDAPMQVVSGSINNPKVHFQAPPRAGLEKELQTFLTWMAASERDKQVDPILRAAVAHLWFVTIHPFDDGNGRLARVITDYTLAQAENQSVRFYAMAASIMEKRSSYYAILENTQKNELDITPWCIWFLETLIHALEKAQARIGLVLQKARFWQIHGQQGLNLQQIKVLNRLLDAGAEGFEGGLTAKKYIGLAKVSKATATRHLTELLEKKCIVKLPGSGRSTRYEINWP